MGNVLKTVKIGPAKLAIAVGTWAPSSAIGYAEMLKVATAETSVVHAQLDMQKILTEYELNKRCGVGIKQVRFYYRVGTASLVAGSLIARIDRTSQNGGISRLTPTVHAPTLTLTHGAAYEVKLNFDDQGQGYPYGCKDLLCLEASLQADTTTVLGVSGFEIDLIDYDEEC
jgi:hypothetical protein